MKKRVRVYFHRSKESNYDLAETIGIDQESRAMDYLKYLGSEIETYFEIDMKTGKGKLIGAEGFFLGDESYQSEKDDDYEE